MKVSKMCHRKQKACVEKVTWLKTEREVANTVGTTIFLFLRHLKHGVAETPVSFLWLLRGVKDYATGSWT